MRLGELSMKLGRGLGGLGGLEVVLDAAGRTGGHDDHQGHREACGTEQQGKAVRDAQVGDELHGGAVLLDGGGIALGHRTGPARVQWLESPMTSVRRTPNSSSTTTTSP